MGTGKLFRKPDKLQGSDQQWTSIPSREVEILLAASCYRNRDKLRPDGPLGPNADLTLPFTFSWVCPVIDRKFRHNIVKVAVDPRGDSRVDP